MPVFIDSFVIFQKQNAILGLAEGGRSQPYVVITLAELTLR